MDIIRRKNHEKEKILVISAVGIIVLLAAILFIAFQKSPLEKYDFTNCRIGIYDYDGTEILEYLSEEESDTFIGILEQTEVSSSGNTDYQRYTGRHKGYCIELENGQTVDISCVRDFLVIDELGYKMNAEEAAQIRGSLDIYWEELFKKIYYTN